MNRLYAYGTALALAATPLPPARTQTKPLPHRVFASSRFNIDHILARPYDRDVPFGSSGDRLWATSPQGWGFGSGVQVVYLTNLRVFDPVVKVGGVNYVVKRADYYPSHVHMIGGPGTALSATASFTYTTDDPNNPLSKPFRPQKRWTCWSSGKRTDWYAVDFGRVRKLTGLDLYFYDDQPGGGCAPPESVTVAVFERGAWHDVAAKLDGLTPGKNTISLPGVPSTERVRLTFHHRGKDKYTGLYGFDPRFADKEQPASAPANITVTGDKWITQNDVMAARVEIANRSDKPRSYDVDFRPDFGQGSAERDSVVDIQGYKLQLVGFGTDTPDTKKLVRMAQRFTGTLKPGESRVFRYGAAVADTKERARDRIGTELAFAHAERLQAANYQGWFDSNIAAFRCSDPRTQKMYYHRWYNVKKNSMYPRLGALKYRTFAEGRWTADWYANVISYGAGHQIRESRWLRDPSYAWGHVQTWADNERPDGIYPSHVTPKGQQGGQYTDWITASAWDAQLVHPSKPILSRIADSLARNAEGWVKVYGWDGSPLLAVDSHWWTGMEWQPSFFAFADYRTGGGVGTDPKYMTALRRVDLTAYNYGNAKAVANIYRLLGRTADAGRLQKLADETRDALVKQMWDPESKWFLSLRASDFAKDPAKEIVGLYPFYFDLPPAGKGYEKAWDDALNPDLFWTKFPLASAAKDCPAYAQNGWPVGPGGSGCMWNGPTWPHANSIVMTGMANTLRHYAKCSLTRQSLFDLFDSFTRAQYRDGDIRYPWTGEYYNGDTAQWKTSQRDYNHSTWVDPLIHDLLGLVARNDDVLEIDPLVPQKAWSWWCLDGQSYRGHDVTIAWDAQGGHVAPGFKGFAVYLDGKKIVSGDELVHVLYDMKQKRVVSAEVRK